MKYFTPAKRVSTLWESPVGRRTIAQLVRAVTELPTDDEKVDALRKCPRPLRDLLRFAYGNFELALPTGENIGIRPIPIRAFVESAHGDEHFYDHDLLSIECHKLVRLFAVGGHATMTDEKRLQLWSDIVSRLQPDERSLLEGIRINRRIDNLPREVVARAFPNLLDEPVRQQLVEEPQYGPGLWDGGAPPAPERGRKKTREEEIHYAKLMKEMGW